MTAAKHIVLNGAVIFAISVAFVAPASCAYIANSSNCVGTDRILSGDRCYVLHSLPTTWAAARAVCESTYTGYTQAHLATITDSTNEADITTLLNANSLSVPNGRAYIGLHLPDSDTTLNLDFEGVEWDSNYDIDLTFLDTIKGNTFGYGRCFAYAVPEGYLFRTVSSAVAGCGTLPYICEYGATFAPTAAPTEVPTSAPTSVPTSCPSTCETCTWDGAEVECLSCTGNRLLMHGMCVLSYKCKNNKIVSGPLKDLPCACTDENTFTCRFDQHGETAKRCKNEYYLHEEQCIETCPAPFLPDGSTADRGRECVAP